MFQIDDDMTIYITRGDVAFFSVTAEDNGTKYKFQSGDVVRIKVFQKKNCENVAFQKDFPILEETERVDILLTEEETKIGDVISKPVDYWYEIELNPYTNPQTIVGYDDDGAKIFKVFPEGRDLGTTVAEEDVAVMDSELSLTSQKPVENQAITRAIVGVVESVKTVTEKVAGDLADMDSKVTKAVNNAYSETERVSNELAVERARITNLAKLSEGSTTGDAELVDLRVGDDGVTYASAGEAVRTQFANVKSDLSKCAINILNAETVKTGTVKGVTLTRNGSEFTANGTANGGFAIFDTNVWLQNETMNVVLGGRPAGSADGEYSLYLSKSSDGVTGWTFVNQDFTENAVKMTLEAGTYYRLNFAVWNEKAVDVTFKPYILIGTTDYGYCDYINSGLDFSSILSKMDKNYEARLLEFSPNLFNKENITRDKAVLSSGEIESEGWCHSEYIEVKSNTYYTVSYARSIYGILYDSNKNIIGDISVSAITEPKTLETTVNTAFIILNMPLEQIDSYMLVEGSSIPKDYYPYTTGLILNKVGDKTLAYSKLATVSDKWIGKNIVCYGDSITWYDGKTFGEAHSEEGQLVIGYESYLRNALGATVVNRGMSGYTFPRLLAKVKDYDYADVDVVTLTCGANDFRTDTEAIGTVEPIGSSFDTTSFVGSFQEAIEYILSQNPTVRIVLITPIRGYKGTGDSATVMPTDYPNAIKEIGALYGLPICDWYYNSGINKLNLSTYIGDISETTNYSLHPTNAGFKRMGEMLVSKFCEL